MSDRPSDRVGALVPRQPDAAPAVYDPATRTGVPQLAREVPPMTYQLPHPFDATIEDLTRAVQALPRDPVLVRDYDRIEDLVEWIGKAAATLQGGPHPGVGLPIGRSYPGTRDDVVKALESITALVPPAPDAEPEHFVWIRDWSGWLWHAVRNVRQRAPRYAYEVERP